MAVKLTDKQRAFCAEYIVDLNATQAAIRAGYKEKTARFIGCENLSKPNIQTTIQSFMDAREKRTFMTADDVLQGIERNIRRCEQGEPVIDRNGDPVLVETEDGSIAPAWKYDPTNALKGYDLLGKHHKLFTEKQEIAGANGESLPPLVVQWHKPNQDE